LRGSFDDDMIQEVRNRAMKLARPDYLGYRPNRADSFYGVAAVGAFLMTGYGRLKRSATFPLEPTNP
jgi:hypothetical protein